MKIYYIEYLYKLDALNIKVSSDKLMECYHSNIELFEYFEGINNEFNSIFFSREYTFEERTIQIQKTKIIVSQLAQIHENLQKLLKLQNSTFIKESIQFIIDSIQFKLNKTHLSNYQILKVLNYCIQKKITIDYLELCKQLIDELVESIRFSQKSENKLWGFKNFHGRWIIEPKFVFVTNFSNNKAFIVLEEENFEGKKNYSIGIIDENGNYKVELQKYFLDESRIFYGSIETSILEECLWGEKAICWIKNNSTNIYGFLDLNGKWGSTQFNDYQILKFNFNEDFTEVYKGVTKAKLESLNIRPLIVIKQNENTEIYDDSFNLKLIQPSRLAVDFINSYDPISSKDLNAMLPFGYYLTIDLKTMLFGLIDYNGVLVVPCKYKFIYTNISIMTKIGTGAIKSWAIGNSKLNELSDKDFFDKFGFHIDRIDFYTGKAIEKKEFEDENFPLNLIPKLAVSSIFNRMSIEFEWLDNKGFRPKKPSDNKYFNFVD